MEKSFFSATRRLEKGKKLLHSNLTKNYLPLGGKRTVVKVNFAAQLRIVADNLPFLKIKQGAP